MKKLPPKKKKKKMNVTTFTPAATKRTNFAISGISGIFKKVFSNPKRLFFVALAILAAIGLYFIFFANRSNATPDVLPLKQSFSVVAKTQDGKNTNGTLKIDVTGAYKTDNLLIQGSKVFARNGKQFMVMNMEISNSYNLALYTYPVDSFRLISDNGKKFAPTAHQGNVETRPQSTKTSNIGFIVPKDQKKFKVEVGELTGEKVVLEFSL